MLRAGSTRCFFCELRFFLEPRHSQWTRTHAYATRQAQSRRPSRLELSHRVAQAPPKLSSAGKPLKSRTSGPFGGLNRTKAGIRNSEVRRQYEPQRRTSRGRDKPPRKERKEGEYKALKMQQALTNTSYKFRNELKKKISSVDLFEQFPLLPSVQESIAAQALKGMVDITPTPIQRVAIPALLNAGKKKDLGDMRQYLLAAETGSGKTLAYLLPIIDNFKRAEAVEKEEEAAAQAEKEADLQLKEVFTLDPTRDPDYKPPASRPRAIVLVPTAELVAQVTATAKAICHTVKFRVAGISAAVTPNVIRSQLFNSSGVDLLVSTPHLLNSIAETEPNILSQVRHLVIDEADSLFDRSFAVETTPIIDRATPSLQQLILCSATIPRSLDSFLGKRFPAMRRLVTPNLHAVPRRVQLGVVEVDQDPYRGDRRLACADTIWTIGKSAEEHASPEDLEGGVEQVPMKRIIVFVNERDTAKELTEYLCGKGIDAVALSREVEDLGRQRMAEALAEFTGTTDPSASTKSGDKVSKNKVSKQPPRQQRRGPMRMLPNTKVLVATDLGSRGIDTTTVRHVVLYDCPHTTIDFIHRLGRTGRMGKRGRGIVLVGRGDRKDVVKEVREAMYMGKALI